MELVSLEVSSRNILKKRIKGFMWISIPMYLCHLPFGLWFRCAFLDYFFPREKNGKND